MKLLLFFLFVATLAFGQQQDSIVAVPLKSWQIQDFKTYDKVKAEADAKTNALLEFVIKDSGVRFDTLKGFTVQDSTLFLAIPRRKKPQPKKP